MVGDRGKGGLASFGTYTLKMTLVVGGVTSVRQSTFKVADPRLAEALAWMSSRNGDTVVTHPGKDPLTVNDFCEEVNEWAYGWFSGTFKNIGYPNAAADYQAQLAGENPHGHGCSRGRTGVLHRRGPEIRPCRHSRRRREALLDHGHIHSRGPPLRG